MSEIDNFVEKYGEDGFKLLVLYKCLKYKAEQELQYHPNLKFNEKTIDRACLEMAYKWKPRKKKKHK